MKKAILFVLFMVFGLFGCAAAVEAPPVVPQNVAAQSSVLASFIGEYNPTTGELTFTPEGDGRSVQALSVITAASNTNLGPDTVTLTSTGRVLNCTGYTDGSVCANVNIESHFSAPLRNVHFWIETITPTSCACRNSDPSFAGLSNTYGLFGYGTIAGGATGTHWVVFDTRTSSTFTFRAWVYADPPCSTDSTRANCGGTDTCVDLQTNASHCGYCGNVCEDTCTAGQCDVMSRVGGSGLRGRGLGRIRSMLANASSRP